MELADIFPYNILRFYCFVVLVHILERLRHIIRVCCVSSWQSPCTICFFLLVKISRSSHGMKNIH